MDQQVRVNLEQTAAYKCKACGKEIFRQVFFLRTIPALLSPTLKAEIIPVPSFMCVSCDVIAELSQKKPEKPQ